MLETTELIQTLTNAVGLSGYEASIHELIKAQFAPLVDEVSISKVGSVIGLKRGATTASPQPRRAKPGAKLGPKRLMLAAHVDEIGLIVTGVEHGFVRIGLVGGTDSRILLGQRVLVHPIRVPGCAPVPGVIVSRPPHLLPQEQREKVIGIDNLFVDTGMTSARAARDIQVGDLVSFDMQTVKLKGDLLTGKAMDNRVSVAAMIVCLDELQHLKHTWDVVAVATAQEEVGFAGAVTSAYALNPEVAIAIDVTFGAQHDFSTHIELGKGPVIAVGPNYHPGLNRRLIDLVKKLDMTYQIEPDTRGGTDAWPIQVVREGIPVALLEVPLRYMHSPVETVNVKDVEKIGRLLANFVASLGDEGSI